MIGDASLSISREPQKLEKSLFLNRCLIGIDGDPGAGKSTLAKEIQQLVGGRIIRLGRFPFAPQGKPYLSQYKASGLQSTLPKASPPPKIIEGVVLLDALELLGASCGRVGFLR